MAKFVIAVLILAALSSVVVGRDLLATKKLCQFVAADCKPLPSALPTVPAADVGAT